jgi:tetratricopeptide (TPR) repeat protein
MTRPLSTLAVALALCFAGCGARAETDPEALRKAKTLFFDRQYAEARAAWQAVLTTSRGSEADAAAYWLARCSENLGEHERALREYGAFLERRPGDAALVEEARTSRIGLATRLYKGGKKEHLPALRDGLQDASKTVRYFSALQLASLGAPAGAPAVPVLKRIIAEEKDPDLVDRAKLGLLRLDPGALQELPPTGTGPIGSGSAGPRGSGPSGAVRREAAWVRVRIYERGNARPKVSVNLPVALAELVFKSLPDDAKEELGRKGFNPDNFWEKLKRLGPTQIIDIEGDDGEKIQIWLE